MKKNFFQSLAILVLVSFLSKSLQAQNFNYLGIFNSVGTPGYLTNPSDVISDNFKKRMQRSLPEYYSVPQYNPQYLNNNLTLDLQLKDATDVWLTFVDEGAGYKNVIGFYTYSLSSPPTKAPKDKDITIIFPNVSYEDNALKSGNKVRLGHFAKNTGIGFVLLADGFKNGAVTWGNNVFYSNPKFNPEKNANQKQHSVLLRDSSGFLVIGFEDLRRDQQTDNDFNDAVFYLTTQTPNATIGTMPVTAGTGSSNVSTGNNGGLESDGCLAGAIASRNFERVKTPSVSYDNPENLQLYNEPKKGRLGTRGDTELEQFIPQKPLYEPVTAFISSPKDLVGITNAQKVLSVDYFDDASQERVAVVLTSKTQNKVYEHTKVVCDRLIGSTLLYTESIMIDEKPFIRSVLQREDGTLEYNISFALAKTNTTDAMLISRWSVDDYPSKPEFWNFQVWAEAPHLSQKVVEEIIVKIKEQFPNVTSDVAPIVPQLFVKKGSYDNGVLTLTIENPLAATLLTLNGNQTSSETNKRENFTKTVILKGDAVETVEIFVGTIFDMGFIVKNNKSTDYDALYFADGAWGLEYDKNVSKINNFDINNSIPSIENGIFTVERDPILRGQVKDYVSLFRTLRPASAAADMSHFKNISFSAKGSGVVEVMLVKKSVTDWNKQYRAEIRLYDEKQQYHLSYKDFTNGSNEALKANDLVNVVFTIKGDGKTMKPFDIALSNVVFDNKTIKTIGESGVLTAFPNPASESTELAFELPERGIAVVRLINAQGESVIEYTEEFAKGRNRLALGLNGIPSGIYIASVVTTSGKMVTKVLIP